MLVLRGERDDYPVENVLKKRLELSTPNLVHIYSMAVARQALTGGQKVKDHGHTVTKTVTVTWLLVKRAAVAVVLLLSAWWGCTLHDCLSFASWMT